MSERLIDVLVIAVTIIVLGIVAGMAMNTIDDWAAVLHAAPMGMK